MREILLAVAMFGIGAVAMIGSVVLVVVGAVKRKPACWGFALAGIALSLAICRLRWVHFTLAGAGRM